MVKPGTASPTLQSKSNGRTLDQSEDRLSSSFQSACSKRVASGNSDTSAVLVDTDEENEVYESPPAAVLSEYYIIIDLFSDRIGLSLHNILSPFLPVMDIFSISTSIIYPLQHSLARSFLIFQPVSYIQL